MFRSFNLSTQDSGMIDAHRAHEIFCTKSKTKFGHHWTTVFKYLCSKNESHTLQKYWWIESFFERCNKHIERRAAQCHHAPFVIKMTLKLAVAVHMIKRILQDIKNLSYAKRELTPLITA